MQRTAFDPRVLEGLFRDAFEYMTLNNVTGYTFTTPEGFKVEVSKVRRKP